MRRPPTLLYHDVVQDGDWNSSGFPGEDASAYKLAREDFRAHLDHLAEFGGAPGLVGEKPEALSWMLTFDDGGVSSLGEIAPALACRGWSAHFFMTTGKLGAPGFLDAEGVRELVARGHVVGSHSVTHPLRMASLSDAELVREWRDSTDALADVLGLRPRAASIPGGAFSRRVAVAAEIAGIRALFTSEPTLRMWRVGAVTCIGRFGLWRGMNPRVAADLVRGTGLARVQQRLAWDAKKLAKRVLGDTYLQIRSRAFAMKT